MVNEETSIHLFRISYLNSDNSPLYFEEIRRHTEEDEILVAVRKYLMFGWPDRSKLSDSLELYYKKHLLRK